MAHPTAHVRIATIIAVVLGAVLWLPVPLAQAAQRAGLTMIGTGSPPARLQVQSGHAAAVRLHALPAHPRVGQRVRFTVVDPPAGATGFAWDLTGPGPYVAGPREGPLAETTFATPGVKVVGVRFTVAGVTRQGLMEIPVSPAPAARTTRPATAPRVPGHKPVRATRALGTAHLAGDPGVTIADFHFSPGATTVHVGDTVTWANTGPSSHSATASNGSFNTGILKKGQSASHTFTQAGTFTYFCEIHPFMHGTIVVLASTTPTTSTATSTSPAAAAPTTTAAPSSTTPPATGTATTSTTDAAASSQPTLPLTGLDVLSGLGAGLLLIGFGAVLRRAVRP
jgi:plastocyanin